MEVISVNVPGKGTVELSDADLKNFEFTYNGKVIPREVVEESMKRFWDLNGDAIRAACKTLPSGSEAVQEEVLKPVLVTDPESGELVMTEEAEASLKSFIDLNRDAILKACE